jgi:peptidoglycan/xylan/chitin deacetylase (PgdA/CDA1 family)
MKALVVLCALFITLQARASAEPPALAPVRHLTKAGVEIHDRLQVQAPEQRNDVAITLDACGGQFDADLIDLLIAHKVSATIFATRKWLDANPAGTAVLLAHPELFDIEDHGTSHVPAVVGVGKRVYGLAGEPDLAHLTFEVTGAADTIKALTGNTPHYYRGAGAVYDATAMRSIQQMGYRIAGFSVNADAGATLSAAIVAQRLRSVHPGDVVIAHMNKPAGQTAEGFAAALPELEGRGYHFVKLSQRELQPI